MIAVARRISAIQLRCPEFKRSVEIRPQQPSGTPVAFLRLLSGYSLVMSGCQKEIRSFFQPVVKAPKKRLAGSASQEHVEKAKDAAVLRNGDSGDPSNASEPLAKRARTSQEHVPATPLHSEEIVARAEMTTAVARVRVEQAAATGQAPRLQDLLVEDSWRKLLGPEFDKPYMRQLEAFLAQEWAAGDKAVFPPAPFIFRALNSVPVGAVRAVILGQDPYHNVGQAMGLSFSVPEGCARPPSLLNIYKELREDVGFVIPPHGNLEKWTGQGILLLNASLTVRAHQANSHSKKGWEQFTDAAIRSLGTARQGLVFLLWGRYAQQKAALIDTRKHHVLKAAHPSGLSAQRANKLLEKEGLPPIDWQL